MNLLDWYSATFTLVSIAMAENVVVIYVYGKWCLLHLLILETSFLDDIFCINSMWMIIIL